MAIKQTMVVKQTMAILASVTGLCTSLLRSAFQSIAELWPPLTVPRRIRDVRYRRALAYEQTEERCLLAVTDIACQSFLTSTLTSWSVTYQISGTEFENAPDFDIAIYRSANGTSLDAVLDSVTIDPGALTAGIHNVQFPIDFEDVAEDFFILVVLDANDDIGGEPTFNNTVELGVTDAQGFPSQRSDAFLAADGTVHVHGRSDGEQITVSESLGNVVVSGLRQGGGLLGITTFSRTFASTDVAAVHLRMHGGADEVDIDSLLSDPVWAYGGAGSDVIQGGPQADKLYGGDDNDTIHGGAGNDLLDGGAGNDILNASAGNDTSYGRAGDDIYVFSGSSSLASEQVIEYSSQGTDLLDFTAFQANVTIDLTVATVQAIDTPGTLLNVLLDWDAGDHFENVYGSTTHTNQITGNGNANVIKGGGVNDTLKGGDGNDTLEGGAGNDLLEGGAGNDLLKASAGNDTSKGGTGDDTYSFDNSITSNLGSEQLIEYDNQGTDLLDFSGFSAGITLDFGNKTLQYIDAPTSPLLTVLLDWEPDYFENVIGSAFNDTITGNSAVNVIQGGGGNDTINGGGGNDILNGGAGNDIINGGDGSDTIHGNAGTDTIHGDGGNDSIFGDEDSDSLYGDAGTDTLNSDGSDAVVQQD